MRADQISEVEPALTRGLLDDAAVFPPGSAELADAVTAHSAHRSAWYSSITGPIVLPASALEDYAALAEGADVVLTFPSGSASLADRLAAADSAGIAVVGVEVALGSSRPDDVVREISDAVAGRDRPLNVSVEVPRDDRANALLAALSGTSFSAKLRVGGVRAELYPDEAELASTIQRVVGAGLSFKATAGLHRAVRNTAPETGFEQHGFLNLIVATAAALEGAPLDELVRLLSERDPDAVRAHIDALGPDGITRARDVFRSFGTCSVEEPLDDLIDMGLVRGPLDSTRQKGSS